MSLRSNRRSSFRHREYPVTPERSSSSGDDEGVVDVAVPRAARIHTLLACFESSRPRRAAVMSLRVERQGCRTSIDDLKLPTAVCARIVTFLSD